MTGTTSSIDYRSILVPFDGSDGSSKALRRALAIAKGQGSGVTVISVDEHTPRYAPGVGEVEEEPEMRDHYFANIENRAREIARGHGIDIDFEAAVGHAAERIVAFAADRKVDLIVIGHSGHSGLWGTLLGGTTARVVDHAPCDVLIAR